MIGYEQVGRTVEDDLLRAETIAFPLLIAALVLGLPRARRGAAAAARRRADDPALVPRPAARDRRHVALGVRAQPRHRHGARPLDRLEPARRVALPRGARGVARRRRRADDRERRAHRRVQLADRRGRDGVAARLSAALPALDGRRRRARLARRRRRVARSSCLPCSRCSARASTRSHRAAGSGPTRARRWYSLARFVMRRAAVVAAASASFLLLLGVPFLRVTFTAADARVLPESASARQVYEQLDARLHAADGAVLRGAARAPRRRRASSRRASRRCAAVPRVLPPRELAPRRLEARRVRGPRLPLERLATARARDPRAADAARRARRRRLGRRSPTRSRASPPPPAAIALVDRHDAASSSS